MIEQDGLLHPVTLRVHPEKKGPLTDRRAKYDLRRNVFIIREGIEGLKNHAADYHFSVADTLTKALTESVLVPIKDTLQALANSTRPEMELVAFLYEILELDLDEVTERAAVEIPYPKSWANLNADGTPKKATGKKAKTARKAQAS